MPKLKKVLNLRVKGTDQAIKLLQALSEMNLDVVADSRPGAVKIRIYGSREEVESAARKIAALVGEGV